MIDTESTFQHHFFQLSITQWIPQVPPYAQENHVGLEMSPFERLLLCHNVSSGFYFSTHFTRSASFLQHNLQHGDRL